MIISAHQPAYMPWLGYLNRISRSDIFVFLDNVQFERNSFINRNRIKTLKGQQWITIPILSKGHMNSTVAETKIDNRQPWRRKHLRSIEASYGRSLFFGQNQKKIESLLLGSEDTIAELCWIHLKFWLAEFEIKTKIVRASELNLKNKKSEMVLELCQTLGSKRYISGPFGKHYLNQDCFDQAGIEIEYDLFEYPIYKQTWGEFIPGLSCIDFWMNMGPYSFKNIHELHSCENKDIHKKIFNIEN